MSGNARIVGAGAPAGRYTIGPHEIDVGSDGVARQPGAQNFAGSTLTHYLLNRFWALPSARADTWRQAKEYVGTAAISWVINIAVFRLCLDGFGLGKMWATAVAVPPSTVVVFLLLNYRVFRAGATAGGRKS